MANIPSDDELVTAATNAGWLLELEAVKSLEMAGFYTVQGWAYQDPDDNAKSRGSREDHDTFKARPTPPF